MSKFYYNEEEESYDAIVVGTGISGGWAAKELCENGLKTLVLERGKMVTHRNDYPTANKDPWDTYGPSCHLEQFQLYNAHGANPILKHGRIALLKHGIATIMKH